MSKQRARNHSAGPRAASGPLKPRRRQPGTRSTRWLVLASLVALGVSSYLLWSSLSGEGLPGCGPASGCDAVLSSRWSSWFGVPVSLPAILLYAGLLGTVYWRASGAQRSTTAWLALGWAAGGTAILGAAVWFTILQLWVIRAICPFCMVAHACGVLVGIQLLREVRMAAANSRSGSSGGQRVVAGWGFGRGVGVGAGAIGLLVLGQLAYEPPSYRVTGVTAPTLHEGPAAIPASAAEDPTTAEAISEPGEGSARADAGVGVPLTRWLSVHDGQFVFDLNASPVIGSPAAPTVVLHFFDYTCRHCRLLHPLLTEAQHTLGDRLAWLNLPVPLDMECNPILQRPMPAHTNACAYARIGLAVWRTQPSQLHEFDDWFFSFPQPPGPEAARAEAARLVGAEPLAEALKDSWIDEYLAQSIRLYHTNFLVYQRATLPLLMVGTNLVSGVVRTTDQLYPLLGLAP